MVYWYANGLTFVQLFDSRPEQLIGYCKFGNVPEGFIFVKPCEIKPLAKWQNYSAVN